MSKQLGFFWWEQAGSNEPFISKDPILIQVSLIVSATTAVYGSNPNYLTVTLLSPICHTHLLHVLWLGPCRNMCVLLRRKVCSIQSKEKHWQEWERYSSSTYIQAFFFPKAKLTSLVNTSLLQPFPVVDIFPVKWVGCSDVNWEFWLYVPGPLTVSIPGEEMDWCVTLTAYKGTNGTNELLSPKGCLLTLS